MSQHTTGGWSDGVVVEDGLQKVIERFFHAASDQFLDLPLLQ